MIIWFQPPPFVRKKKEKLDVEKGKSDENKMDQVRFLRKTPTSAPPLSQNWVGG